jgi:glycosidase
VQAQLLSDVKFWLDRGVDGFRFDAANFYFHDRSLRSNPAWGDRPRSDHPTPDSNPYAWQQHRHDKTQPENLGFLKRLRALLDAYGATTSLGEIGDDDALAVMANYTRGGDKLHMAYTFNLLRDDLDAGNNRAVVESLNAGIDDGWPCWSIGNHDAPEVLSPTERFWLAKPPLTAIAFTGQSPKPMKPRPKSPPATPSEPPTGPPVQVANGGYRPAGQRLDFNRLAGLVQQPPAE